MLRTVINQLSNARQQLRLSVHNYFVPFEMRSRLGLRQTLWFPDYSRLSGLVGYPILKRYRQTLGLTLPKEIDWVFDLSGFCYTDHWGAENALNMRRYLNRQRDFDTKYVIFPQAFGPFEKPKLAEAFTDVANEAVLLCVRDDRSRRYLEELRIETPILDAPDLTTIAPARVPTWCAEESPYVCIVPNSRMTEERGGNAQESYVDFLSGVCERLDQEGAKILFLLFEARDQGLLTSICEALGREVLYLQEDDPVRLRGIIGEAEAIVASRYHALVSALSQGVFALGTSWSHKYEELFKDYGCVDLLISDVSNKRDVHERIDILVDTSTREKYTETISSHAKDMINRAVEMWSQVGKITGLEGVDQLGSKVNKRCPKKFDISDN
jgi:colanic acid/amylovoran biosynthesis protein